MKKAWWVGEFVGTFLLVFFGCGALASAIPTGAFGGIGQVAAVWGIGIAVAIYLTGSLSGAHLNPAVTLGFWAAGQFPARRILPYVVFQCLGSFAACLVLYVIFADSITAFEAANNIVRGQPGSEKTAMIFTEFFANPTAEPLVGNISMTTAMAAEIVGTLVLMLVILCVTDDNNFGRPTEVVAFSIGLTVSLLICLLGPITMACFNPARDLPPRLFTAILGWGSLPFTFNGIGWLTVYVLAPCVGGLSGAILFRTVVKPCYRDVQLEIEGTIEPNLRKAA